MSVFKIIILPILTTISVLYVVVHSPFYHSYKNAVPHHEHQHDTEDVYARVMRTGVLRCGYFMWPPYMMRDPATQQLTGMNYDYMEALGRFLNLKIKWVKEIGVGEVEAALDNKEFDVMCATLWPGATIRNLAYTNPILFTDVYAYVKEGNTRFDGDISKINSADVTLVVQAGDISGDIARTDFPKSQVFALSKLDDATLQMLALQNKKADVAFLDKSFADNYLADNPNSIRPVANVPPVRIYGEHFTLKKGEMRLKELLDVGILTINNSALSQQILAKYPNLASHKVAKAWAD